MTSPDKDQPNDQEQADGLSVLDLANLPPAHYKIMRLMLREVQLTYSKLCRVLEALPAAEQMSRTELDEVLKTLVHQQWLTYTGDLYKANLRHKATRVLSDFQPPRRKTSTLRGIWDSLESTDSPDDSKTPK